MYKLQVYKKYGNQIFALMFSTLPWEWCHDDAEVNKARKAIIALVIYPETANMFSLVWIAFQLAKLTHVHG